MRMRPEVVHPGDGLHQWRDLESWTEEIKVKGAEVSEYVAREAIQLFGGVGCVVDTGVERYWRDAKVMAIGGASVEALMDAIAVLIQKKLV